MRRPGFGHDRQFRGDPGRISPQPAKRVRQYRATVVAVVRAFAIVELDIVILEFERGEHLLVCQPPVSVLVVQVVGAVLKVDPNRLFLGLADDPGIGVTVSDVGKAADVTEHFAELIRAFPGDGEAQMPPLLAPPIALRLGSLVRL